MPKRIEGLQERLVDELEILLFDEGAELTLRALAGRAGVAVGTIYRAPLKTTLFPICCVVQDFPRSSTLAWARVCGRYKIFPPCIWKKYYVFRGALQLLPQ